MLKITIGIAIELKYSLYFESVENNMDIKITRGNMNKHIF
jgi:hypothetical protein